MDDSQAPGSMLTTSVDSSFTAVTGTGPSPTPGQVHVQLLRIETSALQSVIFVLCIYICMKFGHFACKMFLNLLSDHINRMHQQD